MDEESENRVCAKRSSGRVGDLDRLSNLPDYLLCEILLKLPTKDVVRSCVLSKRWRNLRRYVPGLDLAYSDFPEYNAFGSFIDRFLGFNSQACMQKFELNNSSLQPKYELEWDEPDVCNVTRWIDTVLERKVQHLHVLEISWHLDNEVDIPLTVYTCESLVSLKLYEVILPKPESVSLPSVKVICLDRVKFANNRAFEMLISGFPVLESLTIERSPHDNVKVLRVCSQSPRLKTLELFDTETDSFIVNNLGSLVKVNIDIEFNLSEGKRFDPNDLPKRNMIRNFLTGISSVKDMSISSETLETIYNYSRCEHVSLLPNLSSLNANFSDYRWEMLPIFLESCPNLKSISLVFSRTPGEQPISILPGPYRLLQTLEYVEISKPMGDGEALMKVVSYFLENSTILKKLTLCFSYFSFRDKEESVIIKKLLTIPRLSSSCQVFIT